MGYSVAVIGCGVIGKRLGNAFNKLSITDLKYAVDINNEVLQKYCEEFEVEGFENYEELPMDEIDIIYIGVPPKYHHDLAVDAIHAGKHVICEKPISINSKIGEDMVNAANNSDVVTTINFPFKYSTTFQKLTKLVETQSIGEIEKVEIIISMPQWPRSWQKVSWLKEHDQGGPLREIGSHFIYAVQTLFGEMNITSSNVELTAEGKFEKSIDAEFVTVTDIPGRISITTLEEQLDEENTLYLHGSEGKLRFVGWYIIEKFTEGKWVVFDDTLTDTSVEMITEFVNQIETGKGNTVSFLEANKVQKVVDDIFNDIHKILKN